MFYHVTYVLARLSVMVQELVHHFIFLDIFSEYLFVDQSTSLTHWIDVKHKNDKIRLCRITGSCTHIVIDRKTGVSINGRVSGAMAISA